MEQRRRPRARTGRRAGAGCSVHQAGSELAWFPRPGDARGGHEGPARTRAYWPTTGRGGVLGYARTKPGQDSETAEARPQAEAGRRTPRVTPRVSDGVPGTPNRQERVPSDRATRPSPWEKYVQRVGRKTSFLRGIRGQRDSSLLGSGAFRPWDCRFRTMSLSYGHDTDASFSGSVMENGLARLAGVDSAVGHAVQVASCRRLRERRIWLPSGPERA